MRKFMAVSLGVFLSLGLLVSEASARQLLRVGLSAPLTSDQGLFARRFKTIVESLSEKDLSVLIFADGAFASEGALLDHLRQGHLAIVTVSSASAVSAVEELGTLVLPGLVETHEEAVKATTGSLGRYWRDLCLTKGGFRLLGWAYGGARTVSARGPLPRNPDALRELVTAAAFDEWRMAPGTVGGPEGVPLYRYYRMHPFVMGETAWQRLSMEQQGILSRAGWEAQQYVMLMQALKPTRREERHCRPVLTRDQIQTWLWPAFYDLLGGREPINRTLDAINWR
ncbi:hypothetical protein DSLASN_41680 [Desulfoluna limicola]|uniref:Uncharacterized protein n=1 Tax=Desulfoluna limicola TaxID=2810562 RepID=A0ABM7PM58_9BACT|nr:hypothetical protein [Desulfoluna limicola]BCS98536.1 hypothetical protein DSLASN_41680 [Desulfoluna limicola]